jgi:hypothetical protein
MSVRAVFVLAVKVVALTILFFVCFGVAGALALPSVESAPPSEQSNAAIALVAVSLLNTLVLTYFILRSRWSGWRLAVTVFVVLYGVATVMSQIESAFFLTRLPPGMVGQLFLFGAIVAALFSPVAVLVLRRGTGAVSDETARTFEMRPSELVWKVPLVVALYIVLYFSFGYFVAWQSPAVRAYYGGTDPGSFLTQMRAVLGDTPWLVPFQVLRGLMWTALALLVVASTKGPRWVVALALGLVFAVVENSLLLLPNPFMPEAVRMAHLAETASSNFVFGCATGWLLGPRTGAG